MVHYFLAHMHYFLNLLEQLNHIASKYISSALVILLLSWDAHPLPQGNQISKLYSLYFQMIYKRLNYENCCSINCHNLNHITTKKTF